MPQLTDQLRGVLPLERQRALLAEFYDWRRWARPGQLEPTAPYRTWVINAGRGYGKTRTGAETFQLWAENGEFHRGALVGRTGGEVRDDMVEGEAGILAVAAPWARPTYYPGKKRLVWHTLREKLGFEPQAKLFSADTPDALRGPHISRAWADELSSWRYADDAWANLQYMLRAPEKPRAIVTTTPKPILLIKKLYARSSTIITGGSTYENAANLADEALQEFLDEYQGTESGRQELMAELLEEAEGALWHRSWIDEHRLTERNEEGQLIIPELDGLVIAVDPAVTAKATSSETGIIAVGRAMQLNEDGDRLVPHYYVIDDASGRHKPHQWAEAAIDLRQYYEADYIVGETNNGGDLVEYTVSTIDDTELFKQVKAARGKRPRAEPVAAAAAQGRLHFVGEFDELEDQLCNWIPGQGDSPDRLDAMVWGVIQLTPKGKRRPKKGIKFAPDNLGKASYFRGSQSV